MGREAAGPSTLCQKHVGKGQHPHSLQGEPHTQGSPSGSTVRGTRRRGVGLWPHCGRRFRRSHLQVPPLPGVSSLAVIGVGVWQPGGRLGAGLDCLHPLLQAATREHHVAGADTLGPRLPQVLLAVPDAIAKVDEQACSGDRDSRGSSKGSTLSPREREGLPEPQGAASGPRGGSDPGL